MKSAAEFYSEFSIKYALDERVAAIAAIEAAVAEERARCVKHAEALKYRMRAPDYRALISAIERGDE
jgi:hypothetical protein